MDKQQTEYRLIPSKNGRCLQIIENSKIVMSRHQDSSTTTQMAEIMVQYERPSFPLERNLYGHPLVGLLWERQFEKVLLKTWMGEKSKWECLFAHREKGLFFSAYVDDIKLVRKKHNIDPMWKVLNKEVDLGEPTSFLDHVYLGCNQRQCEISKDFVDNYRTMFELRLSAGGVQKNFHSLQMFVFLHGLIIWLVMQRSVWNDIVSWQTRRRNNTTKYLLHASMTTTSNKKKRNLLENCQNMLSNCYEMLKFVKNLTTCILWSVNKLQ